MVATYSPDDIEDLVGSVNAHVIAGRGGEQVFMLTGPDGASLAGNVPASEVPGRMGDTAVVRPRPARRPALPTFTGEFDGYRLLVGHERGRHQRGQ